MSKDDGGRVAVDRCAYEWCVCTGVGSVESSAVQIN